MTETVTSCYSSNVSLISNMSSSWICPHFRNFPKFLVNFSRTNFKCKSFTFETKQNWQWLVKVLWISKINPNFSVPLHLQLKKVSDIRTPILSLKFITVFFYSFSRREIYSTDSRHPFLVVKQLWQNNSLIHIRPRVEFRS